MKQILLYTVILLSINLNGQVPFMVVEESELLPDIAWWKLNGDATDATNNENDGTIYGATYNSNCKVNGCYEFDGTDDSITVSHDSAINNLWDDGGSIAFWIRLNTIANGIRFVAKDNSSGSIGEYWSIDLEWERNINLEYHFSGGRGMWAAEEISSTNTWIHIVVTYNANSTSNKPSFYVDGQKSSLTIDYPPSGTRPDDSNRNLYIGSDSKSNTVSGYVDEVLIYEGELKSSEVKILYDSY